MGNFNFYTVYFFERDSILALVTHSSKDAVLKVHKMPYSEFETPLTRFLLKIGTLTMTTTKTF